MVLFLSEIASIFKCHVQDGKLKTYDTALFAHSLLYLKKDITTAATGCE